MNDMQDKIKDRWQTRRKKAYNWPKLLLMVLAVAAIFYVMNRPPSKTSIVSQPTATVTDSLKADSLQKGIQP